ncbi:WSC domain-containing protein [Ophiocordyceps camponoti-floridani]|uniref:WSC domain-containing protein n=1 Tax=Ophiocordyceps camponoti-floridani TaxID=2030778 RepID=A0A8H4Q5H4_9HYPO|nr:WSC domain-containing protein [Ophiocordyceps camponoti-floridani]
MKTSTTLCAAFAAGANAFWRMECPGRVGLARIDPIVNPDEISNHVHSIAGSSAFSESSNYTDLVNGKCTSCRVKQDKSSYWHPALYFKDSTTNKYEVVEQVGGMLAYYLLNGDHITAFPPGFRMLSGNTNRNSYSLGDASHPDPDKSAWASMGQTTQEDLAQRAIGFNCLNYGKAPEGTLFRHFLPDKQYLDANCKDGVRFEIMFPSCWKGGDAVDSPNHQDHVAFPDLVMTGTCPPTHPKRLPGLLYEVIWNTEAFKDRQGKFVLSNGDSTGYAYHGDFMMGWDPVFLQKAVDTCTNDSGRIEDCPLFDIIDKAEACQCSLEGPMPESVSKEDVKGPMDKLPGGMDSHPIKEKPVSGPVPTLHYTPGHKPTDPAAPLPGDVFKQKAAQAAEAAVLPAMMNAEQAPAPTSAPAPAAAAPAEDNKSYYSTQYVTNGNVVSKILVEAQTVYVSQYAEPTSQAEQNRRRAVHMHKHAHFRRRQ